LLWTQPANERLSLRDFARRLQRLRESDGIPEGIFP